MPSVTQDDLMLRYGINYDTGFTPFGKITRPDFDPDQVHAELGVIARDLHATSVRISGGELDRLELAGNAAVAAGLEVLFAPFPCDLGPDELLAYFAEAAEAAERVRRPDGARVVLVLGCELTLFGNGFLPGDDFAGRIAALSAPRDGHLVDPAELARRFNEFLAEAVRAARARFGGEISYAAGPWEAVDWTPFDLVGVDLYRDADNAESFAELVRGYRAFGKPVVVTEFGCCTYRGAAERGGLGWAVVDRNAPVPRVAEPLDRDEREQVDYFTELMDVFEAEGVAGAFWFTFASYGMAAVPDDPEHDLDLAAYGVVAMRPNGESGTSYPGLPWEPKQVFHAIAQRYTRAGAVT